tara:strand:- start:918 stop:1604 length:687 start_codon:yes stop_codon:yes gene_type:complete
MSAVTIQAGKFGNLFLSDTSSWNNVRNGTTATIVNNQPTGANDNAVRHSFLSGGKGSEWSLYRSYWAFNVTAYSSATISNLEVEFDPSNLTDTNFPVAIIKSTAQGNANTNLVAGDWDSLDFSTLYGGSSTTYWPDTNNISTLSLNSTAISAFTTGYLKLAIVWYYDYTNTEPLSTGFAAARQNMSYTPRINFDAVTGYSNDVIGVSSANISEINDVATANISQVIGV